MMTKKRIFLLLGVPLFLFLTALECEDQCDKCQNAINHMAEKIEVQACNPNTMQKAWDGIREECDHFDSAVGLMAESCSTGNLHVPGCNIPSANLEQAGIYIHLTTSYLTFDFDIIFEFSNASFHFGSDQLEEGEGIGNGFYDRTFLFDVDVIEGDIVDIIVINQETEEEIGRESRTFTFARNSYWSSIRSVEVSAPNPFETEAIVIFTNW